VGEASRTPPPETSPTNFNALPRPAVVLAHEGAARLVRRAETIEDVFARDRDAPPDRFTAPKA
jgi:diaminopimelate decarboxylase